MTLVDRIQFSVTQGFGDLLSVCTDVVRSTNVSYAQADTRLHGLMRSLTQDMTMADETASSRGLFIEQTYPTFPEEKKITHRTPLVKSFIDARPNSGLQRGQAWYFLHCFHIMGLFILDTKELQHRQIAKRGGGVTWDEVLETAVNFYLTLLTPF